MRGVFPLLAACALACTKSPPLSWASPAGGERPDVPCAPADAALATRFATGMALDPQAAGALFPELGLQQGWVARCELRSHHVERCGDEVLLLDPELRFWNRRGELLDVALVTEALVHPRMIMAVRRADDDALPPPGAWLAPQRTVLRRVGPVLVGRVGPD